MHIVLGVLGSMITILVLLNRLAEAGIDLGGLNPFLWHRRRQWQKKLQGNPVYTIESPLDATALLATAIAKCDGDMSSDEKRLILDLFQNEFNMTKKEAAELLIASAYLLGDGEDVRNGLQKVLGPSLPNFTEDQARAAMALFENVCEVDSEESELKRAMVTCISKMLRARFQAAPKWA
jgi:uncharacterized tellurite resistance protein B-like protein